MKTFFPICLVVLTGYVLCEPFQEKTCPKLRYNYTITVKLLQPKAFHVSISDARDIRQLHIFWNHRRPYNRSNPYSTTDNSNVSFNENFDRTVSVVESEKQLRVGDSIFYWMLLITREWERITLHKLNFWIKYDKNRSEGVPVPFSETYYRNYESYCKKDEL